MFLLPYVPVSFSPPAVSHVAAFAIKRVAGGLWSFTPRSEIHTRRSNPKQKNKLNPQFIPSTTLFWCLVRTSRFVAGVLQPRGLCQRTRVLQPACFSIQRACFVLCFCLASAWQSLLFWICVLAELRFALAPSSGTSQEPNPSLPTDLTACYVYA